MDSFPPTVFVVDDHFRVLESLEFLMKSVGLPVLTFQSARDFLDEIDPDRPGCLILDIRMPGMSGLQLQDELEVRGIDIPIIFITGHGDVPLAVQAMKRGAVEFLEKPLDHQRLLDCIHDAIAQDRAQRSLAEAKSAVSERSGRLTTREREVLQRVVAGQSSKEVALELKVSVKTVEAHRAQIMRKMEARSVIDLVHAWYELAETGNR
ncbi:MAG: response regulator [Planctomycetaceae bacterium]